MYQELFGKGTAQLEDLMVPARKFQGLVVDHFGKLADFQMDALRAYTDMGLEQLRAVKKIDDAKSFQDYVAGQSKVAKTLSEKLSQDVNTLTALSKNFGAEVQKLAQENSVALERVGTTKAAATPAPQKAAAPAPKPTASAEKPTAGKSDTTKAASATRKPATTTKTARKSGPRKSA